MTLFTYWLLIIAAVIANLAIGYIINRYALHRRAAVSYVALRHRQTKQRPGEV